MSFPRHTEHLPKLGTRSQLGIIGVVLMLGSLLVANWATTRFGFVPVGFGFEATAGTFAAGITLAARDLVQDTLGRWAVVAVIAVGTVLSFALSAPEIAIASAVAFGFAELADFAAYTPLRARAKFGDRRWAVAVIVSNVIGALADTALFLWIAFGAAAVLPAVPGQLVGKGWATLAYLVLGAGIAYLVRSRMGARKLEAVMN